MRTRTLPGERGIPPGTSRIMRGNNKFTGQKPIYLPGKEVEWAPTAVEERDRGSSGDNKVTGDVVDAAS